MGRKVGFIILLLVNQATLSLTSDIIADEHHLFNKLMTNYSSATRPVLNASDAINVDIQVALIQILKMEAENQVLNTHIWLYQDWKDECLHWNPDDYNGLESLPIPSDSIWLPDLVLLNSAVDFRTYKMPGNVIVEFNGHVSLTQSLLLKSSCDMDIRDFPFDTQVCTLKFSSWTYHGSQVNLTLTRNTVSLFEFVPSSEWVLVDTKAQRNAIRYACCENTFLDLTVWFTIKRMPTYYIFNIIIPCMCLAVLNLFVFLLPPDSGDKISLAVTIFLSFSVFMLVIADKVPVTSTAVPLIGFYLTVTMGMTSLSLILTVFILNLHHCGPYRQSVPIWLQVISHDIFALFLCLQPKTYPFNRINANVKAVHLETEIAEDTDIEVDKQSDEERKEKIVDEWKFVASVLDRFLFMLFLTANVICSVFILYIPFRR